MRRPVAFRRLPLRIGRRIFYSRLELVAHLVAHRFRRPPPSGSEIEYRVGGGWRVR